MEKKSVLVTGAAGFVGGFLQAEGKKRGNDIYGSYRNDAEKALLAEGTKSFFLEFSERETLSQRLKDFAAETGGFEYVIHCAGVTRPERIEEFYEGNVEFTDFFVQELLRTQPNFKKFIFISSLQAMGPGDPKTMEPINESSPVKPFTPYGISKWEAEKRITAIPNLDWIIFRPTSIYGPRDTKFVHTIVNIIKKGYAVRLGAKDQLVSFVNVKDISRALWDAIDRDVHREIYVVSDGNDYSPSLVNEYLAKHLGVSPMKIKVPRGMLLGISYIRLFIHRLLKKPLHVSPYKIKEITARNWRVDNAKMVRELDFKPEFSFEEGLKDALKEDGFIKS